MVREILIFRTNPNSSMPLTAEWVRLWILENQPLLRIFTDEELTTSSAIHGDFDQASLNYSGHQNIEVKAEMEELTESIVDVSNRFGDSVGMISVEDTPLDERYMDDVDVEVQDMDGNIVDFCDYRGFTEPL